MRFRDLRKQFEREFVTVDPQGQMYAEVPQALKDKWKDRCLGYPKLVPPPQGRRLLNHFLLGSDPEFMFTNRSHARRSAFEMGLKVGLAAGCDQNERLVELRPWPEALAINHLASVLCCLRWLHQTYPDTREYVWQCPPFLAGDGIGGHVHFGRKRPQRDLEVRGLDRLAIALLENKVFNAREWARRLEGDERRQVYGRLSDTREQLHGYEYRSMPSWLSSPAQAFVVLATSKLVVCDPELVAGWEIPGKAPLEKLKLLARYHKGRDDDAWLLHNFLFKNQEFNPWKFIPGDFKAPWGLATMAPVKTGLILPNCIESSKEDKADVLAYIQDGTLIPTYGEMAPSFQVSVPKGYVWVPQLVVPGRRSGVGDFIHDLVVSDVMPFEFQFDRPLRAPQSFAAAWSKEQRQQWSDWGGTFGTTMSLNVPQEFRVPPGIKDFKRFILSGAFPIWTVGTVQKDSAIHWTKEQAKKPNNYEDGKAI